jgi:transcriptional regulator with XRE-family HTH domain
MKRDNTPGPPTPLSGLIAGKMKTLGISIRDLAGALDITYEHVRRIVRGQGVPSKLLLESICKALEIDLSTARRLATEQQIRTKFGNVTTELGGGTPGLEPIEEVWHLLTSEQQQDATAMIRAWASRNGGNSTRFDPSPTTPAERRANMSDDFNKIKEWLDPKLKSLGLSAEEFARKCGLSKASIYFYRTDVCRPDVQSMARMCHVLGVPLQEGLAQYAPKVAGRPKGYSPKNRRTRLDALAQR